MHTEKGAAPGDDGPATFVGFQEEAVVGVVVEKILRQSSGTEGILQDEEVAFPVGIAFVTILQEDYGQECLSTS